METSPQCQGRHQHPKSPDEEFVKWLEQKGGNTQPLGSKTKATTLGGLLCFQLPTHPLGFPEDFTYHSKFKLVD